MGSSTHDSSYRRKLALIIGNGNYRRSDKRVSHSMHNLENLCDQLEKINFEVTMTTNVVVDIMDKVKDFATKIQHDDLILVYFFGLSCHVQDKNYLLPVGDDETESDINFEDNANDVKRILDRLEQNSLSPYATILILDCCRSFLLRSTSTPTSTVKGNGLVTMTVPNRTFIQFACAANETADDNLFIKHLLKNIAEKNVDITEIFRRIADDVYLERGRRQRPVSMNGLLELGHIYLNEVTSSLPDIPANAIWKSNARTVAGGHGSDRTMSSLNCPKGLSIDKNQNILIADSSNHRIMKYNPGATHGQRIAGKNMQGYQPHLLAGPSNVIFDQGSKSFIICDYHNRRVLQWFHKSKTYARILVKNVECFGVAMDDEGYLYVSDTERHQVRRYRLGEKYGTVVAGGNGQGRGLTQLNHPTYICIGDNQSVYVSDSWNDRVVRWDKDAKKGVIVAGGHGKGKNRYQLDYPTGVVVDQLGTVYVADSWNHRVMRWPKNKRCGDIIAGDRYRPGSYANQLICPEGLAFDQDGNLYVADSNNHRIQRFNIQKT